MVVLGDNDSLIGSTISLSHSGKPTCDKGPPGWVRCEALDREHRASSRKAAAGQAWSRPRTEISASPAANALVTYLLIVTLVISNHVVTAQWSQLRRFL